MLYPNIQASKRGSHSDEEFAITYLLHRAEQRTRAGQKAGLNVLKRTDPHNLEPREVFPSCSDPFGAIIVTETRPCHALLKLKILSLPGV